MHGVNGPGIGFDEADAQCRIRYGTSLATLADPDLMAKIMHYYIADCLDRFESGTRIPFQ